jgi:AraC-like DNA-binding protein
MRWSFSEFLNLVELRSQSWCFVTLDAASGFSVPHDEAVYFYAVLEGGRVSLTPTGNRHTLAAGEIAMLLSGDPHALRTEPRCVTETISFLSNGSYADTPPAFSIGDGAPAAKLLAGRLKVRWPGGQHPRSMPDVLRLSSAESLINVPRLVDKASGFGAMALLTRAASLLFVNALREHPTAQAAFHDFGRHDPVQRAIQYMQTHAFDPWTVGILAHKVGMGRSNFATRFAKEVGVTPMEFLFGERMRHAATFLEKSDMKVAVIGKRIGYHSEAAFARRFREHFGITPGEMRRRKRNESDSASDSAIRLR